MKSSSSDTFPKINPMLQPHIPGQAPSMCKKEDRKEKEEVRECRKVCNKEKKKKSVAPRKMEKIGSRCCVNALRGVGLLLCNPLLSCFLFPLRGSQILTRFNNSGTYVSQRDHQKA